jgi:hypothetical protein
MLAIIPVTRQTAAAVHGLRVLYEKLGPNREHDLLIPVSPEYTQEAQELASAVKQLFRRVDLLPVTVIKVNPDSAEYRTAFFRKVCQALAAKGNTLPFVWMENATPTNADWLDILEDEWNRKPADRFFLGCVEENVHRARKDGKLLLDPPRFKQAGRFMRFGVYPPDILARCPSLLTTGTGESFETLMRNEIVPVCHLSTTMATVWASVEWEREANNLIVRGKQDPRFESEYRKNASVRVNDSEISVIHGCRDGSLAFVESRKKFVKTKVRRAPSVAQKVSDQPEVAALREENADLKARLARLEALVGATTGGCCPAGPEGEKGVDGIPADPGGEYQVEHLVREESSFPVPPVFVQTDEVVSTLADIEDDIDEGDELGEPVVQPSEVSEEDPEPVPGEEDFAETTTIEEVATAEAPAPEPEVVAAPAPRRPMVGTPFKRKTAPAEA